MLKALVLVCSVVVTPNLVECTRDNARVVMRVPAEFANPVTCFMHGQAYLAETAFAEDMNADDVVKVVCARSGNRD